MKLSDEGRRLNDSFEGKHTLLKDGRYAAYLCPAGVPTIYNGLTKGVRLGMVVTAEEGEAMFAKEIAATEIGVTEAITRPMNQNEFDAFTVCAYNIGVAAFRGSSMCKRFNRGDKAGCARAFELWVKAKDPKTARKVTLKGLVSRRKREAALFLKPVEKPEEPFMPQAVEPAPAVSAPVAACGTVAASAGTGIATGVIPLPPADSIAAMAAWQGAAEQTSSFFSSPLVAYIVAGVVIYVLVSHVGPKIAARFQ